jgi:cell division protease FtsH
MRPSPSIRAAPPMTVRPADHQPEDTGKRIPFVSTWHRTTPARPGPPKKPARPGPPKKSVPSAKKSVPPTLAPPSSPPRWRWLWPAGVAIAFLALFLLRSGAGGTPAHALNYTGFVSEVTANKVSTAAITSAGSVSGKLRDGSAYTSQIPTALNDNALSALLLDE